MRYQLYWQNWKLEKSVKSLMKTAHLRKKTWENSVLLPTINVSHKLMTDTGLASLNCKATTGRHIHGTAGTPLGAVALGAKRKSKRCEMCSQKEEPTHPDVDLRLSCVSANTLFHDLHEKEVIVFDTLIHSFSACPWIYLEGAPSKLRRAKCAVKHLSTFADRLNFKRWPRHRQSS